MNGPSIPCLIEAEIFKIIPITLNINVLKVKNLLEYIPLRYAFNRPTPLPRTCHEPKVTHSDDNKVKESEINNNEENAKIGRSEFINCAKIFKLVCINADTV